MKAKNVDKENVHVSKIDRSISCFELRINGQLHDLDNTLAKIEKEYNKSNARSVVILELTPSGLKRIIKSKAHAATEVGVCGGKELTKLYREKGFEAWKKAAFKDNRQQAKAA